jgi:hypothetical protein
VLAWRGCCSAAAATAAGATWCVCACVWGVS